MANEKLARLQMKVDGWKSLLEERKQMLEELNKEIEIIEQSKVLVQSVAAEVQSQLSLKINNIVNLGLATCFPDYTFELRYVPSRGKTEVQFVVLDNGSEIDVMNQNGGGVVDVLCFCLRVAVYSISNVQNVIILDEPFRFVSANFREKVSELLTVLSDKLGLQFICVTHIPELADGATGKFVIRKREGVSTCSAA